MFRVECNDGETYLATAMTLHKQIEGQFIKLTLADGEIRLVHFIGKPLVVTAVPPGLDEVKTKRPRVEIDALREAVAQVCRIDGNVYGWPRLTREIKGLIDSGKTGAQVHEFARWYYKHCNLWTDKKQHPLPGTITTFWGHAFSGKQAAAVPAPRPVERAWDGLPASSQEAYRDRARQQFDGSEFAPNVLEQLVTQAAMELFEAEKGGPRA